MSDYLTRAFRARLNSAMDSVLRRAGFEIMRIFEDSLHSHQKELAQKGEEVAHLKIKLQTAEVKLREYECGGDGGVEMDKNQMNGTQVETEVALNPSGQTSDVPEIDFEVPDDWCAPLGSENVTKQDEGVCPSIRLRPLLIPLCRIPIIKQEVPNYDSENHQQTKGVKRSKKGSSSNEKHKHTQGKSLPLHVQGTRRNPVRNDMKKLLQDIKEEYSHQTGTIGLRKRGRNLIGKEQETTVKKTEEENIAVMKSEHTEQEIEQINDEKRYLCKFCKKVFDTPFGLSVHIRSHKRCRGCKKEFPFPSSLRNHKTSCEKLKKLLAKIALRTNPPQPESCGEENSEKQVTHKESSSSSGIHSQSSNQKSGSVTMYSCSFCNKKICSRFKLKEHMRVHTGEKPFPCSMCPKKFRINQSLKNHTMRMHRDKKNSTEMNRDLAWTVPLEDTEDNQEDSIPPSKDTSRTINRNKGQREHSPDMIKWQTMGVRNTEGFTCLVCLKFVRNKRLLIEHYRIHTGERPIKCEKCPAKFRTYQQIYIHRKRCRYPATAIQCEKCEKKFLSKAHYDKHMSNCLTGRSNVCKVCGKGFFTKGRLRNHVKHCRR